MPEHEHATGKIVDGRLMAWIENQWIDLGPARFKTILEAGPEPELTVAWSSLANGMGHIDGRPTVSIKYDDECLYHPARLEILRRVRANEKFEKGEQLHRIDLDQLNV